MNSVDSSFPYVLIRSAYRQVYSFPEPPKGKMKIDPDAIQGDINLLDENF